MARFFCLSEVQGAGGKGGDIIVSIKTSSSKAQESKLAWRRLGCLLCSNVWRYRLV